MTSEKIPNFTQMTEFWTNLTEKNFERTVAMFDQWAKLEKKAIVQASNNVDEMAKLTKASIDYVTELNDQARDIAIESMKSVNHRFAS